MYAYSCVSLQWHWKAQSLPWNPSGQGLQGRPSNDSKPFKHSVKQRYQVDTECNITANAYITDI